jgi:hypothetical protein
LHRLSGSKCIEQKFANPEETFLENLLSWRDPRFGRYTGRLVFGSNIAFDEDIPPLPDRPVVFAEESAGPWLTMSEGVILGISTKDPTLKMISSALTLENGWNDASKVKFYMKLTEMPVDDLEFILTASPRTDDGAVLRQKTAVYANNRQIGEWIWDRPGANEKRVLISRSILA